MPKAKKVSVPGQGKGKTLRPFHQFSHLPAELQTRVWELIDPEPRVVELRRHCTQTKKQGNVEQIRCLSGVPAILHVCREARHVACLLRAAAGRDYLRPPAPRRAGG